MSITSLLTGCDPLSENIPVAFKTSTMHLKGQILAKLLSLDTMAVFGHTNKEFITLSLDTLAIVGLANREFVSLLSLETLAIFGLENREFIFNDFGTLLSHPMQTKGQVTAFVIIQDRTFL